MHPPRPRARSAPRPATGRQDRHAAPRPRDAQPGAEPAPEIEPASEPLVPGTAIPRGLEYYQRERAHPRALGCLLAALACCAIGFALLLVLALLPPGESVPLITPTDEAPIEDDDESPFVPFAPPPD